MSEARQCDAMAPDLKAAIGLAWGLVDIHRTADALTLCNGCLQLWPESGELQLLQQLCSAELDAAAAAQAASEQPPPLLARWPGIWRIVSRRARLGRQPAGGALPAVGGPAPAPERTRALR